MNDFFEMLEELKADDYETKQVGSHEFKKPLRTIEEEKELKARQRAGEVIPGRAKWKNGRRVRKIENLTEKDFIILTFLSKVKYASTTQLALLQMVKPNTISKRMQLLENINLVEGVTMVDGGKKIWSLKKKALNLLIKKGFIKEGEGYKTSGQIEKIGHYLGITQAYIMAIYGKICPEIPPVRIDQIVSEIYIERGFKEYNTPKDEIITNINRETRKQFINAARYFCFDRIAENPKVWVPLNLENNKWHLPDGAISFEKDRKSLSPVSYAIEVELTVKTVSELKNILESYQKSKQYKKVIYVVNNKKVFESVKRVCLKIGFEDIIFCRLLDKNWEPYNRNSCWDL